MELRNLEHFYLKFSIEKPFESKQGSNRMEERGKEEVVCEVCVKKRWDEGGQIQKNSRQQWR